MGEGYALIVPKIWFSGPEPAVTGPIWVRGAGGGCGGAAEEPYTLRFWAMVEGRSMRQWGKIPAASTPAQGKDRFRNENILGDRR